MSPAILQQLVEAFMLVCFWPYATGMYRAIFLIAFGERIPEGEVVSGSRKDCSSCTLHNEDLP